MANIDVNMAHSYCDSAAKYLYYTTKEGALYRKSELDICINDLIVYLHKCLSICLFLPLSVFECVCVSSCVCACVYARA